MKNLILIHFCVIICLVSCVNVNKEVKKKTNNYDLIWEFLYEEKSELLAIKYGINVDTARMIITDYVSYSKYTNNSALASLFGVEKQDTFSVNTSVYLIANKYALKKQIVSSYLLDFQLYCFSE